MLWLPSPKSLFVFGGCALALGVAILLFAGESPLAWALLIVSFPPLFEATASANAARIGSMIYEKNSRDIELMGYNPTGALFRCCYLLCVSGTLFLLGKGGYNILPDSAVVVPIITVPIAIYVVWLGVAYWKSIAVIAKQQKWRRRR